MENGHLALASQGWVLSRVDARADEIAYWEDPESGIIFDTETALRIADGQRQCHAVDNPYSADSPFSWVP
jgi:hypothetical protein